MKRFLSASLLLVVFCGLLAACGSTNVHSGPVATLSFSAMENIGVSVNVNGDVSSYNPSMSTIRWVTRAAVYNIATTGRDDLSGMQSITLGGSVDVTCISPSGIGQQKQGEISQTVMAPADTSPTTLSVGTIINMQDYVHEWCSSPYYYHSLDIQLTATATNAHGEKVTTPFLKLYNDPGAASIRVATFNIGGDQPAFQHGDPHPLLKRYGRDLLSQADIVFLQEVRNSDWVNTLGDSAGLTQRYADGSRCVKGIDALGCLFGYEYTDGAILSRYPLTYMSYTFIGHTKIIDGYVIIDGQDYRIIAAHFDADNLQNIPKSASFISSRLQGETHPIIVGGDFNSKPTDPDYKTLTQNTGTGPGLTDAYLSAEQVRDQSHLPITFCSNDTPNTRGSDWVLYNGPYITTGYQACLNSDPSDHNYILVTLGHDLPIG